MAEFEPSAYAKSFKEAPTCMDLFCGAGGLTLGFCQAGGIPIAAVDHDNDSMETYRRIFPMCEEAYCGDIEQWQPTVDLSSVDVMIGGPPCQGFSLARGLRFVDDPRNHLYKHFVRLVDQYRPTWIVLENVPGITNIGGGEILRQIYEDFENIGYRLDHRVINMADFGVPQTRKRAIFIGSRVASSFSWPVATHFSRKDKKRTPLFELKHYLSVGQALSDLPWPMGNFFSHRANSQMRGPRNRAVDTDPAFTLRVRGDEFALCEEPANGAFAPGPLPDVEFVYCKPANGFQALMREETPPWLPHPVEAPRVKKWSQPRLSGTRKLAIREQARLQTFPDWFTFTGRPYSQARQIGNAVPPLFARQLFTAILKQMQLSNSNEAASRDRVLF